MKNLIIYSNNIFLTFLYQCVGFSPQKFSGSWKTRVMNCFIFSFQRKNRLFETPSSLTIMVKLSALPFPESLPIGPLQLAILVVENRHAGNQKSHRDKTNKGNYHLELCMPLFVLSHCDFRSPALRFVPPEWLAAKGLFTRGASIWFLYVCSLERKAGKVYSQLFSCDVPLRSIVITSEVLYR